MLAGDVYSGTPHAGRGGWTWYTGSASWYLPGGSRIGPRISPPRRSHNISTMYSPEWSHFEITYRFRSTTYAISVENPTQAESGAAGVWLDDQLQEGNSIALADDNLTHHVRVVVGQHDRQRSLTVQRMEVSHVCRHSRRPVNNQRSVTDRPTESNAALQEAIPGNALVSQENDPGHARQKGKR